jgi:hypothetical protein
MCFDRSRSWSVFSCNEMRLGLMCCCSIFDKILTNQNYEMFPKVGQPTTEDPLPLPDQSEKSKTFVNNVTLDNEVGWMTKVFKILVREKMKCREIGPNYKPESCRSDKTVMAVFRECGHLRRYSPCLMCACESPSACCWVQCCVSASRNTPLRPNEMFLSISSRPCPCPWVYQLSVFEASWKAGIICCTAGGRGTTSSGRRLHPTRKIPM